MKIYVAEITYLNPVTMQTGRLYLASKGYTSQPTDSPANTTYDGTLKIAGTYDAHVFRDGITAGMGDGGFGKMRVVNNNGKYDWLRNVNFDGQCVTIMRGDHQAARATFKTVFTGVMCTPAVTWNYVDFQIRDYTTLLATPLSWLPFLGNNVPYGQGIEGTPDDLINKCRPLGLGYCEGASPALVNAPNSIWMLHGYGAIEAVLSVKVGGQAQTLDTTCGTNGDCATLTALYAANPASGKYCTCLAMGLIRLGTGTGNSVVTVDFRGDADPAYGGYAGTVPQILERIIQKYVQKPRTNLFPIGSDEFLPSLWSTSGGMTVGGPAATSPFPGLNAFQLTGGAGATLAQNVAHGTDLTNASIFVQGQGSVTLKVADANAPANCFFATYNLGTGAQTDLQTQGQALGPQYTVSGFVTDANLEITPNGYWRLWTCGQPNQAFTNVLISLIKNDLQPLAVAGPMLCNRRTPPIYTAPGTTGYDPPLGLTIDPASFAAISAAVTAEGGYYIGAGNTANISDAMNALCVGPSIWFLFNRMGNMICGQLARPSQTATPKRTWTTGQIIQGTFDWTPFFNSNDATPAFRINVQGNHNNTPMNKADIPQTLWTSNPLLVAWLTNEWRQVLAEDDSILTTNVLACELDFTSYLASLADCQVHAARMLDLYKSPPNKYTFQLKDYDADGVDVGETDFFTEMRFYLTAGVNCYVLGVSENLENGETTLEVIV